MLKPHSTIELTPLSTIDDYVCFIFTTSEKQLSYSYLGFKNEDIFEICRALANNKTIEVLDLSSNCFDNFGAISIARMLEANSTIKQINLTNNRIEESGKIELLKAVERSGRNIEIDISNNPCERKLNPEPESIPRQCRPCP